MPLKYAKSRPASAARSTNQSSAVDARSEAPVEAVDPGVLFLSSRGEQAATLTHTETSAEMKRERRDRRWEQGEGVTGENRFTSHPIRDSLEADVPADLEQPRIENRRRLPPASVEGVLNGKNTAAVQCIVRVEIDLQPPALRELEDLAQTKIETRHPVLEQRVRRDQLHRGGSRAA